MVSMAAHEHTKTVAILLELICRLHIHAEGNVVELLC